MALKLDNKGIGAHRHEREALQAGKADAWTGAGGELGSLFERLNAANAQAEEPKPAKKRKESKEEEATPKRSKPAEDVARPAPSAAAARLAHRAKFRRAKQMVGTDASSLNEILGISSAEASARSSPAAEDKAQTPNARASAESSNESEQSSDDEPSSKRRKGKDKGDKGEVRSAPRSAARSAPQRRVRNHPGARSLLRSAPKRKSGLLRSWPKKTGAAKKKTALQRSNPRRRSAPRSAPKKRSGASAPRLRVETMSKTLLRLPSTNRMRSKRLRPSRQARNLYSSTYLASCCCARRRFIAGNASGRRMFGAGHRRSVACSMYL